MILYTYPRASGRVSSINTTLEGIGQVYDIFKFYPQIDIQAGRGYRNSPLALLVIASEAKQSRF